MSKDNTAEHRYLFHNGRNYRSYEYFGAHKCRRNGKDGYIFRVWAPRAAGISLVGDFNGWDTAADPFVQIKDDESIWECFSDRIEEGGPRLPRNRPGPGGRGHLLAFEGASGPAGREGQQSDLQRDHQQGGQ